MNHKIKLLKRVLSFVVFVFFSFNSFAAVVSDNDGSAFITKAEFDSLKNSFQSQIDGYNQSIDSKIDGAIASYLAGIKLSKNVDMNFDYLKNYEVICMNSQKELTGDFDIKYHFYIMDIVDPGGSYITWTSAPWNEFNSIIRAGFRVSAANLGYTVTKKELEFEVPSKSKNKENVICNKEAGTYHFIKVTEFNNAISLKTLSWARSDNASIALATLLEGYDEEEFYLKSADRTFNPSVMIFTSSVPSTANSYNITGKIGDETITYKPTLTEVYPIFPSTSTSMVYVDKPLNDIEITEYKPMVGFDRYYGGYFAQEANNGTGLSVMATEEDFFKPTTFLKQENGLTYYLAVGDTSGSFLNITQANATSAYSKSNSYKGVTLKNIYLPKIKLKSSSTLTFSNSTLYPSAIVKKIADLSCDVRAGLFLQKFNNDATVSVEVKFKASEAGKNVKVKPIIYKCKNTDTLWSQYTKPTFKQNTNSTPYYDDIANTFYLTDINVSRNEVLFLNWEETNSDSSSNKCYSMLDDIKGSYVVSD